MSCVNSATSPCVTGSTGLALAPTAACPAGVAAGAASGNKALSTLLAPGPAGLSACTAAAAHTQPPCNNAQLATNSATRRTDKGYFFTACSTRFQKQLRIIARIGSETTGQLG